ncbi:hypothetical protein D5H75_18210 [Bailinhaonella thermotolerans]|uniref:Leucine rich repeat variant n=1 Tax=Bailinhaonella thermotolerans TaxID=1070861 RepID=A0A3A4B0U3_9ACTN|nr:hypothetical protein D5H75_18210 [Bailinhaonella thermotolerans]
MVRRAPAREALKRVARHPNASPAALAVCLTDEYARPLAAAHPALPVPVLVALLGDEDEAVAEAAAANPSLPPAEMARLIP